MKFNMNFKYGFGFILLISLVLQACAWKWQNALALNEALQNFIHEKDHPFLGKDVVDMENDEKMKICTDASTIVDLATPPQNVMEPSDATDVKVQITTYWYNNNELIFKLFSCGETEGDKYYFGKGPRKNTIAVYILPKNDTFGAAFGIMDYTAPGWKCKDVTEMSTEEKIKICTDAAAIKDLKMPPKDVMNQSDKHNFEVGIPVIDEMVTFWVFSCGQTENPTYYFGKGPCENTIAVYEKKDRNPMEYGIIDYSWQPQQ